MSKVHNVIDGSKIDVHDVIKDSNFAFWYGGKQC